MDPVVDEVEKFLDIWAGVIFGQQPEQYLTSQRGRFTVPGQAEAEFSSCATQ